MPRRTKRGRQTGRIDPREAQKIAGSRNAAKTKRRMTPEEVREMLRIINGEQETLKRIERDALKNKKGSVLVPPKNSSLVLKQQKTGKSQIR